MITALLVGAGGMVGALVRFGVDACVESLRARRRPSVPPRALFPAGTLIVNTAGSLLIGIVWGLLEAASLEAHWYVISAAGLAGGLSTFSTLSVAAVTLWRGRRPVAAIIHLAANLALGLGAAALGVAVSGTI